ncbi:unnamed protein product [Rotaria sp. Silwood1]|nr:unnamed protein product [Rotaria sp. Silwood1]CAF5008035.1 unnamed protein product [Rotaria sp. Silwood1]
MYFIVYLLFICKLSIICSVSLSEFFPFGTSANDTLFPPNDDLSTNALPLPHIFPYFNINHRQIYLANNGLLSFLGPISQFVPTPFPLSDNGRLIAGFWSDIDTRGNISSGNLVYYHIYANRSNNIVFGKAATYVQQYFSGERVFNPSMIIIGTWYRVGAYSHKTALTNTFQIVLATDEIRSFAFLLYHDLQWSSPQTSSLSGPSSSSEIGGQAGFNAGDGVIFEMLPYSRTSNVRQLVNLSNVNVPGLFVFRIDSETIAVGGCGNTSNFLFQPHRGSQLGSTAITVQGPYFGNLSEADVKCRFGESPVVDAVIINEFKAICLTPAVPLPGSVNIYLSIDGGITYKLFPRKFTYTPAEYGLSSSDEPLLIILNYNDFILTVDNQLTLGWYLSEKTIDQWVNNTIKFEVQLWSVTLNETNGSIKQNTHIVLQSNLIPRAGFQTTSITIPSIHGSSLPTVFFRAIAYDTLTRIVYAGFNSVLFVLNDPVYDKSDYCHAWASKQPSPDEWNENLLPCPLTLAQARAARCCYEPDPLCKLENVNRSLNCRLHRGRPNLSESSAIACYLSRTTNRWNAGAECCYDGNEQLITRGTGGGTDDRYRPASSQVLHLLSDILPYLACCLLNSNREACERYFIYRPHRRGSNSPNSWGGTWGDPHFTTLDGSTYTFNGYGEYTYLAITNSSTSINTNFKRITQPLIFNSQIRTTPLKSLNDSATVIRGLAAKSNDFLAEKISITISPRNMLIVRRGNETLDLDTTNNNEISINNSLVLFFPEMTLEQNRTSGVLTLSWFIGVSIQVTPITISNGLVLNIDTSVAGSYRNRTFGLLGLYDNNPDNDLRAQNGTILGKADTLSLEQIHRQFGQTWTIEPNHSLFYYGMGDSAINYTTQNHLYVPSFVLPELPASRLNLTLATCNIDPSLANRSLWTVAQRTCYYDMGVTNDTALGQASRAASETFHQITMDQRYPPEFNSDLPLVLNANDLTPIIISFMAVSPYTSNISYKLINGPESAIFDNRIALFTWQNPTANNNQIVVRVTAQDMKYNLLSTHELVINVFRQVINTTLINSIESSHSNTALPSSETMQIGTNAATTKSTEPSDGINIFPSTLFMIISMIITFALH